MIVIEVKEESAGRYSAWVAGTRVVASSRAPFLAAARALLRERWDCGACEIVMRHKGSDIDALRSTVGAAARLIVDDTRTVGFSPYKVPPSPSGAARID